MQAALLAIIHDGAQWNVAAFHLLVKISLIKDLTQTSCQSDFMQSS